MSYDREFYFDLLYKLFRGENLTQEQLDLLRFTMEANCLRPSADGNMEYTFHNVDENGICRNCGTAVPRKD